jgi:phosphoesterase RecJ-like protein
MEWFQSTIENSLQNFCGNFAGEAGLQVFIIHAMNTIDWKPIVPLIESHQRILVSSHVRPDADAIGSALGLACLLKHLGKTVRIVNPSAPPANLFWIDPEQMVETFGGSVNGASLAETDLHIIVDTSAWQQLGELGKWMRTTTIPRIVIDHHVSSDDLGAMEFKDTRSEATGSLIFRLCEFMNAPLTQVAATALYAAIATDTGWFRFPATNAQTMQIAGSLMERGADPTDIYRHLYEQSTLARLHLCGRVLGRAQLDADGLLASTVVKWSDFVELGAVPADTEDLVNECLRIAGTRAAYIGVEQMNSQIKFSFRSRGGLNVASIAEKFGGGGHKQAAGATLPGPLDLAHARVHAAMLEGLKALPDPASSTIPAS